MYFSPPKTPITKLKNKKSKMIKIKTLLLLVFIFIAFFMQAQEIEMVKKSFSAPQLYQNGERYKMAEIATIMEPNVEAVDYMNKARNNYTFALIFSVLGGIATGATIGTLARGDDPQWGMVAAAGGLTALIIPFVSATNKNSKKAVDLYNAGLTKSEDTAFLYTLKFGVTGNGVGVMMQF